MSPLAKF
jgi:hypothetical protein